MVEVVQGKVEELSLDAQVDVLVSEPMGTLLVNERMLETYLYARNRYLKKGGRMFPVSKVPCTLPVLIPPQAPNALCVCSSILGNCDQAVASWSTLVNATSARMHANMQD